jgi:16S rRNA G966 N2-methylase RsmD
MNWQILNMLTKTKSFRKDLGQFFSGQAVAALLSRLARAAEAKTIIDPMCGTGDLLQTCISGKPRHQHFTGIEIDPAILQVAKTKMKNQSGIHWIKGDAFSPAVIKQVSPAGFDLVIANPPYIRYQGRNGMNMSSIRQNLIYTLEHFQTLDKEDRRSFTLIISAFSGLSDIAVPSWILCAMMVKVGGHMAIVVPETWMNRDYAAIIKYLLLRWFQLEYIVEDAHAAWFKPAQVKTILIVAKRIPRKNYILSWGKEFFNYSQVFSGAMSGSSLVGNIYPSSKNPEQDFVHSLDNSLSGEHFENKKISIKSFAEDLVNHSSNLEWFFLLELNQTGQIVTNNGIKINSALRQWAEKSLTPYCYLSDLGVSVSQGLRTGANDFFYLGYGRKKEDKIELIPLEIFDCEPFWVPLKYIRSVIRKQAELSNSFSSEDIKSKSIILALQDFATPADLEIISKRCPEPKKNYKRIPENLNRYIEKAAQHNFKDLTAVKTNIRKWDSKNPERLPRFWYMLPSFAKRHAPDLFVPRVNAGFAKTRINVGSQYLIDANFSTLWIADENSKINSNFLLALLNSSWSQAAMEEYGTVMGGGALKLEATQLKKIPFPFFDQSTISQLAGYGKQLLNNSNHEETLSKIDRLFVEAFHFDADPEQKYRELQNIKQRLLEKRINR